MISLNYKYLTLFLAALAIYLLWMDVGQYLELQKFQNRPPGNILPSHNSTSSYSFSPFCPIKVKLLMLPPSNQYVDEPLGYFTVKNTAIAEYISPNAASLIGVGVALVSARLMANPEIKYRHLGVLLFKVRDYIDGLDGNIARERNHSHNIGQVANPSSFGWMVDGVCDGFGDIFRFIAFIFVLHRALQSGKQGVGYTLLPIDISDKGMNLPVPSLPHCGKLRGWLRCLLRFIATHQRALLIVVAVGLQSLFSSILWNYFMINYHRVLETDQYWGDVNYEGVVEAQGSILRSSSMWMVCYFWRLVNPQSITQVQLLAILYNREVEILLAVPLIGYLPSALVGLGSYVHLQLAEETVRAAAFNL